MHQITPVTNTSLINATSELAQKIWQQHYLPIIGQAQIDYMLDKFQSPQAIEKQIAEGQLYYLVGTNNDYSGYLALVPEPVEKKLKISKIYVDIQQRGAGYGKMMFDFTKQFAIDNKLQTIWLTVNKDNDKSINWYKNQGFILVKEVVADIGKGYVMDDYILEYQLTAKT